MEKIQAEIAGVAFHRYPDPGAQQVCAAAAELFGVEPAQVVAGNGSDELISVLFTCFLDKGSKVLICDPDFSMYRFYGAMAEMEIVDAGKRGGAPDPEEIVRCAQKYDVSAVIFSNPCNPTGKVLHREAVLELIRSLPEVLIVVDEAYMDFWDQSIVEDVASFSNALVLRTCSKAIGLAGIRLGLAIGGEAMIDLVKLAKSPYNVNALTQAAALAVLREKEYLRRATEQIVESRKALMRALAELARAYPEKLTVSETVTNFVLVESPQVQMIYDRLLRRGIRVRKLQDTLRITAGSHEENQALIAQLQEILKSRLCKVNMKS